MTAAPRFADKALIITGTTGIGAAAARLARAEGAHLLVAGREEESCFELGAETGAECWVGDLLEKNAAESILAHCLAKFGRVDALFNVAGLSGRRFGDGPLHECADDGWEITMANNLTTMFRMCRAVLRRMLQQEPTESGIRGAILNMGSVLAVSPEPRHFATHAYAAGKGAVIAMSRSMAAYYAPHKIRVNVIAPGLVNTPMSARAQENKIIQAFIEKKQPLAGGMVDAEDIARTALFLLSDDARAITGDVVNVDAGWSVTGV
jgi:NAD(P)-dependent dehydrogenase (short-subunit alcohol dehydrogenase family)